MLTAVAAKTAIPREWGLSLADSGGPCLFVTASRHRSGATNITLAVRQAGWSWGAFRTSRSRASGIPCKRSDGSRFIPTTWSIASSGKRMSALRA